MQTVRVKCIECGEKIEIPVGATSYGCMHCGHFEHEPKGDVVDGERATSLSPETDGPLSSDEGLQVERIEEAEGYFLQATFILHSLQANLSVYGSNSAFTGAQPADVELALKYINRCLEIWPDNPKYLNLKALFLIEGKGAKEEGLALMERAAKLAPDDITIQDNLEKSKSDNCFIASAVFESQSAKSVTALRKWRDRALRPHALGRGLIFIYYSIGPDVARWLKTHPHIRYLTKRALERFAKRIGD
jgi:tetratricopeptide (TPR) repeat protein